MYNHGQIPLSFIPTSLISIQHMKATTMSEYIMGLFQVFRFSFFAQIVTLKRSALYLCLSSLLHMKQSGPLCGYCQVCFGKQSELLTRAHISDAYSKIAC